MIEMTDCENILLSMLSAESAMKDKRKALERIADQADIGFLIRPDAYRSSWDYCAKVLFFVEDDRLAPHLSALLQWVEALNDEGSEFVELRLAEMDAKMLAPTLNSFIIRHGNEKSNDWYYGIRGLAMGRCRPGLSVEAVEILERKRIESERSE